MNFGFLNLEFGNQIWKFMWSYFGKCSGNFQKLQTTTVIENIYIFICNIATVYKELIATFVYITGHHLFMYRKQMQFYTTNYVQLTCRRNQYRNLGTSGSTTSDKSFLGFILEI